MTKMINNFLHSPWILLFIYVIYLYLYIELDEVAIDVFIKHPSLHYVLQTTCQTPLTIPPKLTIVIYISCQCGCTMMMMI